MNQRYIFGSVIVVLVCIGVLVSLSRRHAPLPKTLVSTSSSTTTTASDNQTLVTAASSSATKAGVSMHSTGAGKVQILSIENASGGVYAPSLARPVTVAGSATPEEAAILKARMQSLVDQLRKEPKRVDLWLSLGVYRKMAGDYPGAIEAWNYVSATGPSTINFVAYGNLGDLYQNFVKDYTKAELNYKKAIAIKPTYIDYYRDLYMLYRYQYKTNTSAAADILTQGLMANPNNSDLLVLQTQLTEGK